MINDDSLKRRQKIFFNWDIYFTLIEKCRERTVLDVTGSENAVRYLVRVVSRHYVLHHFYKKPWHLAGTYWEHPGCLASVSELHLPVNRSVMLLELEPSWCSHSPHHQRFVL